MNEQDSFAVEEAVVDPLGQPSSEVETTGDPHAKLQLSFSGRIIDHLGIQMYQSPVAAIAEIISNAWDAEAESVEITLPAGLGPDAIFTIRDTGNGMTFEQCQERFLTVGRNRRSKADDTTPVLYRAVLGRKGIGKFAGFGIAKIVYISTISGETGEKTVFQLDIDQLRGEDYVQSNGAVEVLEYLEPDDQRRAEHSTTITLKKLKLGKTPNAAQFSASMARRFALRSQMQNFAITVNGSPLADPENINDVEMLFPRDYKPEKLAEHNLEVEGEWATEVISGNQSIKWRIAFYDKPVAAEDLKGIAIFAHVKLAQKPFEFQVVGASGQHGLEYMSGRVQADYIDTFPDDLIATERQRINWETAETAPLLAWGQARVRELLGLWRDKRSEGKIKLMNQKLAPFTARLQKMQPHERRTIESALKRLAGIPTLDAEQFISLSESLVLAWEGGRLKELIDQIGQAQTMDGKDLLDILVEAKVLTSLHTAEAVKAKLDLLAGLNERIQKRELENAVRDYIAENPWLIDHEWETFKVENSIKHVCEAAAQVAKLNKEKDWEKRIDLVLSSGEQLLILEFMQPGLTVDRDHLDRFELYFQSIEATLEANTGSKFKSVSGLLVCDRLDKSPLTKKKLDSLGLQNMQALDWQSLLARAADRWKDFLSVLIQRAPDDQRLRDLAGVLGIPLPPSVVDPVGSAVVSQIALAAATDSSPKAAVPDIA